MRRMKNNDLELLKRDYSIGDYFEDRNYVVYRTAAAM
jgi:hypothetical protein